MTREPRADLSRTELSEAAGDQPSEGGRSAWRTVARSVFTVEWSQIELGGAVRCTAGVLIPLVVGISAGAVADGVAAAVGALCAGFASFQGAYRSRASLTVVVAAGMAVSTMAGALAARNIVSAVLVTALWGGVAGMMVSLGQGGLVAGLQWVVAELIVGAIPMTLGQAAVRAGMVLAGGVIQTVLVVALWPVRTYRLERRSIEAAYLDLASLARGIASGDALSRGAITINDARKVLEDPQPFSRTGQLLAFQALVDEAERIRIELTALARHRSRLEDPQTTEALDRLGGALAAGLQAIASAIAHDRVPVLSTGYTAGLSRDSAALEQAIRARDVPGWVASELDTVTNALNGQLRSAAHIAAVSSGMTVESGFAGRDLPRRQSSPMRMPLETLSANLSWQSEAFRHAVRLAATLAVATVIYRVTALQHGYWLPLTALVILRPDFTSTAVRGVSRILGTIAGAALATLLAAWLRPDDVGLTVLFSISVFVSYVIVRANYTLFSITVTAYVVFLLAFVKLPAVSAVTYRLTSTVLGGALAMIAYLLWPTWESRLVGPQLADLLEAQADYSAVVLAVFANPTEADRRRLSELRSVARRSRSNAEASLERMAGEPPRALRSGPLSLGTATSVLAGARRFTFALLTLHSGLPPVDAGANPEVTPLSRGVGGRMRGDAALLRTLVPPSRIHAAGGPRSEPSRVQQRLGHPFSRAQAEPTQRGSGDAGRSGDLAGHADGCGGDGGRGGYGGLGGDERHGGQGGDGDDARDGGRAFGGDAGAPPSLRELHTSMAAALHARIASADGDADLIGLLIAETDLMVDSVNTVSEVLGRGAGTSDQP